MKTSSPNLIITECERPIVAFGLTGSPAANILRIGSRQKCVKCFFLVRLGAGIIAARLRFADFQVELVLLVAAHVRVRHVVQRVAENITNIN